MKPKYNTGDIVEFVSGGFGEILDVSSSGGYSAKSVRGLPRACKVAWFSDDEIVKMVATGGWLPIITAPTDHRPVDIWTPLHGRLTNYKRVTNQWGRVVYDPIESGVTSVSDATHWRPIPMDPDGSEPELMEIFLSSLKSEETE